MSAQQSTQGVLDAIAYVAWHGICVRDEREGWVQVDPACPRRPGELRRYRACGRAVHAGGNGRWCCGRQSGTDTECLYSFEAGDRWKYTRRAMGELLATGEADAQSAAAAKEQFADTGPNRFVHSRCYPRCGK